MLARYKKIALKNGLRVVTAQLPTTKAVTVMVLVGAGSRYETKATNGVAHFLEHMFFKGGRRYRDAKEVSSAIDGVGGEFNAFTGNEYAGYFIKVRSSQVELALDVLSDMLLNARFPNVEIQRERKVILEEYNLYEDTPSRRAGDFFGEMIFKGPLGLPVIGSRKNLQMLSRRDLLSYESELYAPDNMVVSLAGSIVPKKAARLVNHFFKRLRSERRKSLFSQPAVTSQEGKVKLVFKKTEQAHLLLGVPAFSARDERRHAIQILAAILGGGMSSRLFLSIREEHGLAYYVSTEPELHTDAGYLATATGVDVNRVDLALRLIVKEYERLKRRRVFPKELRKAKEAVKGRLVLGLEESNSIASHFGLQELLLNQIETPETRLRYLDKVTAEDVRSLAGELFQREKLHLALIGPYRDRAPFEKILGLKH